MDVACVLRSGGQYNASHVEGLKRQVDHYMPQAGFVCLSDVAVPCDWIPLATDWPVWWAKIGLFEAFKGKTLFLDLDTVLVADPTSMMTGDFQMCRNWRHPQLMTSAVMAWEGDYSHITRAFAEVSERVMREYVTLEKWGDQAFIAEQAGDVKAFADGDVVSYRLQMLDRKGRERMSEPPAGTKIVAFNGNCPPWNGPEWARRWW
jgi:hypothetical protein